MSSIDDEWNKDEELAKILDALNNKKFKWRTIKGVAKESGISPQVVQTFLYSNTDSIVKAPAPSEQGEALFTTREHFLGTSSFGEKLLGALKNRIS